MNPLFSTNIYMCFIYRNFDLLPNERYVFATTTVNRKENLVVYDSIDKKIVSQAKMEVIYFVLC